MKAEKSCQALFLVSGFPEHALIWWQAKDYFKSLPEKNLPEFERIVNINVDDEENWRAALTKLFEPSEDIIVSENEILASLGKGEATGKGEPVVLVRAEPKLHIPDEKCTIRFAQRVLKTMGLYSVKIDGMNGTKTRSALMKFQMTNGIPSTGFLDTKTCAMLRNVILERNLQQYF